jgi:predicted sulfurtransferase
MLEEQVRAEKAEFEAVIRKQKEVRDLEAKLENERKELLRKHAVELKKQIVEKQELKEESKKVREIDNQQLQETFQGQKALL